MVNWLKKLPVRKEVFNDRCAVLRAYVATLGEAAQALASDIERASMLGLRASGPSSLRQAISSREEVRTSQAMKDLTAGAVQVTAFAARDSVVCRFVELARTRRFVDGKSAHAAFVESVSAANSLRTRAMGEGESDVPSEESPSIRVA